MILLQDTPVSKCFNSIQFQEKRTNILFEGLSSSLFSQKRACGNIDLPAELGHLVFEYLSVLDIYLLKRINTSFRACVNDFTHFVFKGKTCFDFSTVSDTQLITYFLQDKIHSLILKAFGRALVEAPFLGKFKDTGSIPSHERYAIARGLVAANEPFISFYIGRRDKRPFTVSTERIYDNQRWQVALSIPATQFIYVQGLYGCQLASINHEKFLPYFPNGTTDRDNERLGDLYSGFDRRFSNWSMRSLILISEVFENLDDVYVPFTSEVPICETISTQELIEAVVPPNQENIFPAAPDVPLVIEDWQEPEPIANHLEPQEESEFIADVPPNQENIFPAIPDFPPVIEDWQEPELIADHQGVKEEPLVPEVPPNVPQPEVTAPSSWYFVIPTFIWQQVTSFWSWVTSRF